MPQVVNMLKGKVNQELETAKELCQRLGYLPLALQLVGRYVKKRKISLTEELQRLEGKGLGHPSLSVPENDPTWTLNIKRGVEAAFELSWDELSEEAQQLGCLLSLFALAPIPWSLLESAAVEQDSEELEDARVELENLHLLEGEDTYQLHHTYQLHQLIHEFFRNKQTNLVNADEQKYNFCTAIVEVADKIPQTPTVSKITSLIPFIPHLGEAVNVYQNWLRDEDLIRPFMGLGRFYAGQGAYAQALPWLKQCQSVAKERLGEDHPDVASSLNNLALLYYSQGRYEEAEPLYLQALELIKRLLGEDHPDVASSLNNLALLYYSQGRYEEAEPLLRQALKIAEQVLGENHSNTNSTITGEESALLIPDRYWVQIVLNNATERITLDTIEIKVNPSCANANSFDGRSSDEIELDAVTLAIAQVATKGVAEYQIKGRQVRYQDLSELTRLRCP